MSISSYVALKAKMDAPYQKIGYSKIGASGSAGVTYSDWTLTPNAGAIPTSAAPDRTTIGALGNDFQTIYNSSTAMRVGRVRASANIAQSKLLIDRLSHTGGLSGTTTGAQTTNLPTTALTRYTSGVGVLMAVEIYTAVGATATTLTVSYTNQAGTSGQTSPTILFGGAGANFAHMAVILPLQIGDTGVRSVENVTIAASTLTAGNFGITLFRPLLMLNNLYSFSRQVRQEPVANLGMMFSKIQTDACLSFFGASFTTSMGVYNGVLDLIQE